MAKKPSDIKAFSFLDLDPRAVADQLRRAGWTLDQVHVMTDLTRDWARAVQNEAGKSRTISTDKGAPIAGRARAIRGASRARSADVQEGGEMKSVNEIKEAMESDWIPDDQDDVNRFIFEVLIAITERLEAQEKPCDKRAIWGQVDPDVRDVMERLLAAEKRQKKLEEWTNKFQEVKMPLNQAVDLPTYTAKIERAAMIEALRWVRENNPLSIPVQFEIADAITRIKDGGDL